ncbi:hypothetical protein HPP92_003638 [Vanilla planifolia]|uniref:Acyl-[acyl-carrier-protein] hydrolase n=1 Tax=Vanilla planifolia TaxID=51239 RepID=A0A835S8R7_VANPL|nr:hypothetical protein HPP92_003638 [Vanilla planifolia]
MHHVHNFKVLFGNSNSSWDEGNWNIGRRMEEVTALNARVIKGDVVQVETWFGSSGKNGVRRDWQVIDYQSGEIVVRATSIWVMMNKSTRKLTKMIDEIRAELEPYFVECTALVDEDNRKLRQLGDDTTQYYKNGIVSHWGDLDMNQHINSVKYIGWILEECFMF